MRTDERLPVDVLMTNPYFVGRRLCYGMSWDEGDDGWARRARTHFWTDPQPTVPGWVEPLLLVRMLARNNGRVHSRWGEIRWHEYRARAAAWAKEQEEIKAENRRWMEDNVWSLT